MGSKSKIIAFLCLTTLLYLLILFPIENVHAETGSSGNVSRFVVLASSEGSNVHAIGLLIFARDVNYNSVKTFTGSVYFSSNVGTVTPVSSGSFSEGFWKGTVSVNVTNPKGHDNLIISVDDGYGHTGSTSVLVTSYSDLPNPTTMTPTSSPIPVASPTLSSSPIQQPTPMPTPSPSPTVPEFSLWILPLLLSILAATAGLMVYHKKHKHNLVKEV